MQSKSKGAESQQMKTELYSIKMRASQTENGQERHVSGAEKIVSRERLDSVVSQLLERALTHAKGKPDFINLKLSVCPKRM